MERNVKAKIVDFLKLYPDTRIYLYEEPFDIDDISVYHVIDYVGINPYDSVPEIHLAYDIR